MKRRAHPGLVVVSVLAVLVLGGCGGDGGKAGGMATPSGTGQVGISDPALASRVFIATRITEGGADRAMAGPEPVTLSIAGDGISARAGCNTLMGSASIDGGALAVDAPLASTEMACEDALMAQDAWLADFLTSGPTVTVEGSVVTLTSGETVMTLTLDEDAGLYDTPVAGPEDYQAARVLCEDLVASGATVDEATARGEDAGFVLRVVSEDGEDLPATTDLNPGRLNLQVAGGVVTGCTAG